ncbi:MAG: sugar ABC transporter permease [Chloroflexi bacterium]|nr:sugar ABC transporter permease [Chloroflexota bacterium]
MSPTETIAALSRILLFYAVVVGLLFLELTLLSRAAAATRGQKSKARAVVILTGVVLVIAALVFVFDPRLAVAPAIIAILLSILLAAILRRGSWSLSEPELALLFIIPAAFGIFLFYYYQIGQTIIFSLHHLDHQTDWSSETFVGLGNYLDVFTGKSFLGALFFTVYFTVVAVFLEFWIGLGMAISSFGVSPWLRGFIRSIIVIPWAIPPIISANIWKWLFNADVGLGYILKQVGIVKEAPVFLADPTLATYSVILADVWKMSSMMAILLIGGLAVIPREIYDAAQVDGARAFYRFRRITLPMLAPTILVALLFRCMDALRTFDLIYGLTKGGPGTSTETLSSFTYKFYFTSAQFGLGSAYGMVVFVMILCLSVVYLSRIRRNLRFRQ